MKALCGVAAIGLMLLGSLSPVSAQPYGGYDDGYRGRNDGYQDRGSGYRERRRGYGGGGYVFNERAYLRCNPDVLRAVRRGIVSSGAAHYRANGRYEGRRLSC